MLVIAVENAPPQLRGRLTIWLTEITTGLYIGTYSRRVHDRLWKETTELIGAGRAFAIWPSRTTESGFVVERAGQGHGRT
jgi:CRISPR-associated protein Cas2